MVFNDAAFRTQQWESELQLAGDQYRMQAAQQATGALQQVGSQWSQQRNQNAQFGAQMGMQQQELDQNAAMVNARLQLMEQERQENAIKLQSLQQLDQAKISRETTRTAELQNQALEVQNRAREFELRKQEKMFSTFDEDRRQNMLDRFDPKMIEGMALQGMVLDVPEDGGPMRVKRDKEGAASILERIQGLRRGDRSSAEERYRANNARQAYNSLFARYYRNGRYFGPPEKREEIEGRMRDLEGQFTGYFSDQGDASGGYPSPAGGWVPRPDSATPQAGDVTPPVPLAGDEPGFKVDPFVEQMAALGYQQMQQHPEWVDLMGTMSDASKAGLLYGLGQAAADLVKNGLTTAEMAPGFVIEAASGTGTEAVYVLTMANFTEDRIRAILEGRGAPKERIDAVIKRVNDYVASRRRSK